MNANVDFTPPADPWELWRTWFAAASEHEINDPNAMSVATVDADGMPSVRILLLKECEADGFVFFTNRASAKGQQLAAHPKAALCFHWKSLRRQVRAEGLIVPVSDAESDAYFATRPYGSQIGAWASLQSQPLENRAALETRVHEFEKKYAGKAVTRPLHWGGYRLTPLALEFWQDREFRLHDRITYRRPEASAPWTLGRLYP